MHVIQDKIYCLGGGTTHFPLIEIHHIPFEFLYLLNKESAKKEAELSKENFEHGAFVPENTSGLDLSDTTDLTSCVLGNRIYIFKPVDYTEGGNLSFSYYDLLTNVWHRSTLPEKMIKGSGIAPICGKAISDGNAIYLFCAQIAAGDKTKLTVLKFNP